MGIYLNPGNENFTSMTSRKIYVDKTRMISVINEYMDRDNKYICVSRPRRFGKTIASKMLSAYYSKDCDSRELFSRFEIADDPGIVQEIMETFPNVPIEDNFLPAETLIKVHTATRERFVIIIIEYDLLVRERVDESLFKSYLSFLNGLFKSSTVRPAIALAYLTGILPVVRDKIQSKLNNFIEYTILDAMELAEFVDFTAQDVKKLCAEHDIDYETCRHWYDGYSQRGYEIYNPESVVMCINSGRFANFWGKTSTYRVIADNINMDFKEVREDVIRMLSGEEVPYIWHTSAP